MRLKNDSIVVDERPILNLDKEKGVDVGVGEDKGKGTIDDPVLKQIPPLPRLFLKD